MVFGVAIMLLNQMSLHSRKNYTTVTGKSGQTSKINLGKVGKYVIALVPLMLSGITSSEERVLTLEVRGFSIQGERTHLFNLNRSGWEGAVKVISTVITVLVVVGRIVLWVM